MPDLPLPPGSTLGILGGGQLGRMLSQAASRLGFDVVILDPEPDSPAGRVSSAQIVAAYDDPSTCYFSEPMPTRVPPFRPYKHLARCGEWQIEADDD